MIKREVTQLLQKMAQQYPIVGVMGPRQSGKTTLVKEVFSDIESEKEKSLIY